jgi:3-hydroxyacyl-CoA dehydrogenase/enoyl-CoA hydratase/3-hydroxybutyryl-CoA epimerase
VIDERGIGWITFDDPDRSLNVLTEGVMRALGQAIDSAKGAAREGRILALVVRSAKADSFVVGADIDAIASLQDAAEAETKIRLGQAIFSDLAELPVPTLAAVHGICLGGGLELALACRHRVASDSKRTSFQFPEVMLGILPAWGGTTRLPRLVGLRASLDMLLAGRKVDARQAERIGLVDEVLPAALFDSKVRAFVEGLPALPAPAPPAGRRGARGKLERSSLGRAVILAAARRKVVASTGGHYPAPLAILEILKKHGGGSVEESLAAEARNAAALIVSPVCKNLVHVYRLREAARKGTGLFAAPGVEARAVSHLGVLGAGTMGGGIAHLAADHGVRVYMKDIHHEAVAGGLRHAHTLFTKAVERRRIDRREAAQRMDLVAGGLDYHGIRSADLVVEAVVERMDVKKAVLAEIERHVSPECVIATNTSSLSVDEMAATLASPERFCGMHFFNPVDRMPLVEVVRGRATSARTIATVYALALQFDKVPVVVRDGPGFLVNRILGPYLNEAGFLLGDGASVEQVDGVAKRFGMPMGPLRLIDEVGIDISRHAGASLHAALGERMAPAPVLVALGHTGRLGRKSGSGFYRYEDGRERGVDPTVYEELATVLPPRRELAEQEIRLRLLMAMVCEAARILEDGIVGSAGAVDLAMIMGTGFPPFRGGLLRHADTLGAGELLQHARALRGTHGERFAPPPLLERLAAEGQSFYGAFPGSGP